MTVKMTTPTPSNPAVLLHVCLWLCHVIISAAAEQSLGVVTDSKGRYQVAVEKQVWLDSAATYVYVNGARYSTADGSLQLVKQMSGSGMDGLGSWKEITNEFKPKGHKIQMLASIRTFDDIPAILFKQSFPDGVPSPDMGDAEGTCTGFPSFSLRETMSNTSLGYLAFGGIMFGQTKLRMGRWGGNMTQMPVSGLDSGPLVLFNTGSDALVISSFTSLMAGSAVYNNSQQIATWGLLGRATKIPLDFEYSVIIYYSNRGISKAIAGWGEVLRSYYNRHTAFRDSDLSNNYLGYYTDNGAYYYYLTEQNKTYEKTLVDVKIQSTKLNIPYRYVQYDSWWYHQGPAEGVTEWVSKKEIFPNGMRSVWNQTNWVSVAHNRWWSDKTVYAKQNGGRYNFIIEPEHHKALPVDQAFWDFLMSSSRQWGLVTYEQDWLNVQFDEMKATVSDLRLGRTWLRQMGTAAAKNGLTLQYCMCPSRHALQSLEIPVVSQARVSNDYLFSPDNWRIGVTSMFAHAMGVAPFKDNFWTTSVQPGNRYNKTEPHPALQAVVATLSTGPVAASDKLGYTNVSLLMRSCNSDGLLLKPSRPATAIDDQIKMAAAGRPLGEVWTTHSHISGLVFGIILAADMRTTYYLGPSKAGFGPKFLRSGVFSFNPTSPQFEEFSDNKPLKLSGCGKTDFCLHYTTPVLTWQGEELLFYGELDKWVPMSPQRVKSISIGSADVKVRLQGALGEVVNFSLTFGGRWMVFKCKFANAGSATVSLLNKQCTSW